AGGAGRPCAKAAAFGLDRALDVHEARVEAYKAHRLGEKKAGATVNRELAALRRAFRLGVKQKRISRAPEIEMLAEAPPREWSVRGWWRARSTRSARRALIGRGWGAFAAGALRPSILLHRCVVSPVEIKR